jgi:hypothetical protein
MLWQYKSTFTDYRCLVENAVANSSMHSALAGAYELISDAVPVKPIPQFSCWKFALDLMQANRVTQPAYVRVSRKVPFIAIGPLVARLF